MRDVRQADAGTDAGVQGVPRERTAGGRGGLKVSQLKLNKQNPRQIRDEKFERLKKSITDFPEMMQLRPIIVDSDNVVLGGNMRLRAIRALGMKDLPDGWVKRADELTPEQRREFIIKDNNPFGEYDWDAIANEWSDLPLADWGLDVPGVEDESIPDLTDLSDSLESLFKIEVSCVNEAEQEETYNKLTEMGYQCRVLTL